MKVKVYIFLLLGTSTLILSHCAKVGRPSGGQKDTLPPRVTKSEPSNYSTGFEKKQIEVTFDEFIQLKELNQKLIISPPMENKPDVRLKGKSFVIDLEEELKENTTYTFNFFDAIVDNNEGNPLPDFEFVVTTGEIIDSLSIGGRVLRAFDLKPDEEVMVVLHENFEDSSVIKDIPVYVTRADEDGFFRMNNLKADTFRLFAIKEVNMNYKFDQPEELIAFHDTLVIVAPGRNQAGDTTSIDTTYNAVAPPSIAGLELFLFNEEKSNQYLKNSERNNSYHLLFIFNQPLLNQPEIKPLDFTPVRDWYLRENYSIGDSLSYWITDTAIGNIEILQVELTYLMKDSLNEWILFPDTVTLRYTKPVPQRRRRGEEEEMELPKITITSNASAGVPFDLNKQIRIESPTPVLTIDTSKIMIYESGDTMKKNLDYQFAGNILGKRIYYLSMPWKDNTGYELLFLPGAFTDIYNTDHDSTLFRFRTRSLDYYGAIIAELRDVKNPLIIQVLTEDEKFIKEEYASNDTTLQFNYLSPGKYKLKAIIDWNKNKEWDTGDLLLGRQPEEVIYYQGEIQVRSNWDIEIEWTLITTRNNQTTQ